MFEIHARAESHGATKFQFQYEQLPSATVSALQTHENQFKIEFFVYILVFIFLYSEMCNI